MRGDSESKSAPLLFPGPPVGFSQAIPQSQKSGGTGCWDLRYVGLPVGWAPALGGNAGAWVEPQAAMSGVREGV